MVLIRTNLHTNPRYLGDDGKQGSGSGSWPQEDIATGGSDGRGYTQITVTSTQTGLVDVGTDTAARIPVTPRQTYTLSTHAAISHIDTLSAYAVATWLDSAGTVLANTIGAYVASAAGDGWRRYGVVGAVAPDGAATVQIRLRIAIDSAPLDVDDTIGIGQRMVERVPTMQGYFDGDTPDTSATTYEWDGAENASTSTATTTEPPSITATVLTSSTEPPPVQLAINDLPEGDSYVVSGMASGGRTWRVAGGTGVSEGVQILLVDNRAPVNTPVRYRLVTSSGEAESNQVTIPWGGSGAGKGADPKYLIQSLDGNTVVPIAAWIDNQLPQKPVLHTQQFDIRGRKRPVMVLQPAGDGTLDVQWRLTRSATTLLEQILADGGGIVVRTDGTARDLPVSDVAVITDATNVLWGADNGISTDRVWDITLTWIDDPEPGTIPVVWDVGEVDALLAGDTVADVDARFAGMTVAELDAIDWGTVTP